MKNDRALSLTGFSLIAVTYGLARFSWGLMQPEISHDIPFTPHVAGMLAACSFIAYCLASLGAAALTVRAGPRLTGCGATLLAAAGLGVLAGATSPWILAVGLFIAGLSSGLASPCLAAAVSRQVSAARQPQVNTLINAGTGGGIILSVPVLMLLPGGWRSACLTFAVVALLCLIPLLRWLPGRDNATALPAAGFIARLRDTAMRRLALLALLSGVASAAWWSFGPDVLRQQVQVDGNIASLLWLVSGGAGVLGVLTGPAAARFGLKRVYRASQFAMALPLLALAMMQGFNGGLILVVALCGAGYITLSGVLLVYGTRVAEDAPAAGVGLVFFMLASGQIVGSMLFGMVYSSLGAQTALTGFCLLGFALGCITPARSAK